MNRLPILIRKLTLALSLVLLIGILFQRGSAYPASAAAGDFTQTSYDDFSSGCLSLPANTTHTSDAGGGAIELPAALSDDFLTSPLDTGLWSSGLWSGPGSYDPSISGGVLSILGNDHAWVRSVSTFTHGIMEVNAQFGDGDSQHIGFVSDGFASDRYLIFSTGFPKDGNLHARVNNNGTEINFDLGPNLSEFHRYRIEWSEVDESNDEVSFVIDGETVVTQSFASAGATNLYLYLSNDGLADLHVDSAQSAPAYAASGIYTSCPFDAGADAVWDTLSWDETLTMNTTVDAEINTSSDGITWEGWVSQANGGTIAAPARWLQYRLTLNSTSVNETPLVNEVTRSSIPAQADLAIVKTGSAPTVDPNGVLTYTLSVANLGPDFAYGVLVQDVLPAGFVFSNVSGTGWTTCGESAGTVTCTLELLGVGAAPDITITGNAPADGGTLSNTATVDADTPDPDTANNTSSTDTAVNAISDLSLIKTDSPDPLIPGATLTYTLSVSNAGPSKAGAVSVSDTLPAGLVFVDVAGTGWTCGETVGVVTCTMPSLAVGSAADITIHGTTPLDGGILTNTATVSSSASDPSPENNSSSTDTTVNGISDLSLLKSGSPDPVEPGGLVTYTLSVSNAGPSKAVGVSVSDTLPAGVTFVNAAGAGWTCGESAGEVTCGMASLAVGSAADITIHATAPLKGGTISNTATVSSNTTDPVLANNTSPQVSILVFYSSFLPLISR